MSDKGIKHDSDKEPWELLPLPALTEVVKVLLHGQKKYAAWNWEKGIEFSRLYGAALRHLTAFIQGEDNDEESGLSHLAHAMCCLLFLLTFVLMKRKNLDNRYIYQTDPCDVSGWSDERIAKFFKKSI